MTLSGLRAEAAARLDAAVARELAPLKLDAARFKTVIEPVEEAHWTAAGRDRVEFEVSTNPGAPLGPLLIIARARKSVVSGKSESVRVSFGGRRLLQK